MRRFIKCFYFKQFIMGHLVNSGLEFSIVTIFIIIKWSHLDRFTNRGVRHFYFPPITKVIYL